MLIVVLINSPSPLRPCQLIYILYWHESAKHVPVRKEWLLKCKVTQTKYITTRWSDLLLHQLEHYVLLMCHLWWIKTKSWEPAWYPAYRFPGMFACFLKGCLNRLTYSSPSDLQHTLFAVKKSVHPVLWLHCLLTLSSGYMGALWHTFKQDRL